MTASIPDNKYMSQSSELIYSDRWRDGGGWQPERGAAVTQRPRRHQKATKRCIYRRKTEVRSSRSVLSPRSHNAAVARRGLHNACTDVHVGAQQRMETDSSVRGNLSSNNHKVAMVRAETAAKAQRLF